MKQNWNALSERNIVKRRERVRLGWKPLYTRIVGATVSLLLLLALEFFLLKLVFVWY
jgi:hypothetical protein